MISSFLRRLRAVPASNPNFLQLMGFHTCRSGLRAFTWGVSQISLAPKPNLVQSEVVLRFYSSSGVRVVQSHMVRYNFGEFWVSEDAATDWFEISKFSNFFHVLPYIRGERHGDWILITSDHVDDFLSSWMANNPALLYVHDGLLHPIVQRICRDLLLLIEHFRSRYNTYLVLSFSTLCMKDDRVKISAPRIGGTIMDSLCAYESVVRQIVSIVHCVHPEEMDHMLFLLIRYARRDDLRRFIISHPFFLTPVRRIGFINDVFSGCFDKNIGKGMMKRNRTLFMLYWNHSGFYFARKPWRARLFLSLPMALSLWDLQKYNEGDPIHYITAIRHYGTHFYYTISKSDLDRLATEIYPGVTAVAFHFVVERRMSLIEDFQIDESW